MNLNGLTMIEPKWRKDAGKPKAALLRAAPARQNFSNVINLSSQISRPEDQGGYGTCVAWSSTTFIESLLWKLTGEKEEFTTDEVYNLYLDAYGYNPNTYGYNPITADRRRAFYNGGSWDSIPEDIGGRGLYHWNANIGIFENYDY